MCYPQIRNNVHLSLKPFRTAKASEKAAGEGNHLLVLKSLPWCQLSRAGCSVEHRPGKTWRPRPPLPESLLTVTTAQALAADMVQHSERSCSCRGPGLDSQHQGGSSNHPQLHPGNPMSFSDLRGHQTFKCTDTRVLKHSYTLIYLSVFIKTTNSNSSVLRALSFHS